MSEGMSPFARQDKAKVKPSLLGGESSHGKMVDTKEYFTLKCSTI